MLDKNFIYCPKCKNKLVQKENHIHCDKCNFNYYLNPGPASVLILINNKSQVYLAKRQTNPGFGKWDLPGGFIAFHESAEDALKREIKEELNLELKNIKYFGSYQNEYLLDETQYYPIDLFFISTTEKDYLDISGATDQEFSEGKFFDIDKIPWDELAFISQENILKDYVEYLKK